MNQSSGERVTDAADRSAADGSQDSDPVDESADLPAALAARYPELGVVGAALQAHRDGRPVTDTCPRCGSTLSVDSGPFAVEARCAKGHVLFRGRGDLQP